MSESDTSNPFADGFDLIAAEVAKRYGEVKDVCACDIPEQLGTIIQECYAASMKTEEKRQTTFAVVCSSPDFAERVDIADHTPPMSQWDHARFDRNVPLAPDAIRKLSAAFDPNDAALLIWTQNDAPVIWGMVRLMQMGGGSAPGNDGGINHYEALRILGASPGALTFDNLNCVFAEIRDLRVTYRQSIPVLRTGYTPFWNRLNHIADQGYDRLKSLNQLKRIKQEFEANARGEWREAFRRSLSVLLSAMCQQGCGGTLVILPEETDKDAVLLDSPNNFMDRLAGEEETPGFATLTHRTVEYVNCLLNNHFFDLLEKYEEAPHDDWTEQKRLISDLHDWYSAFNEMIKAGRFVGRLSAADGAVIASPIFEVYCFGAKLKTEKFSNNIVRQLTWDDYSKADHEFRIEDLQEYLLGGDRGNRFKSAVSCASIAKESVVFVASEDGPLCALTSVDDKVVIAEPMSLELR